MACRCKKPASRSYIVKTLSVVIFDLVEALLVAAALALLIGAAWVSL